MVPDAAQPVFSFRDNGLPDAHNRIRVP